MNKITLSIMLCMLPGLVFGFHYKDGHSLVSDIEACNAAGQLHCEMAMSYVQAVNDTHNAVNTMYYNTPKLYCIKGGDAPQKLVDVVFQYLETHPVNRKLPAATLVLEAFVSAWPCPVA